MPGPQPRGQANGCRGKTFQGSVAAKAPVSVTTIIPLPFTLTPPGSRSLLGPAPADCHASAAQHQPLVVAVCQHSRLPRLRFDARAGRWTAEYASRAAAQGAAAAAGLPPALRGARAGENPEKNPACTAKAMSALLRGLNKRLGRTLCSFQKHAAAAGSALLSACSCHRLRILSQVMGGKPVVWEYTQQWINSIYGSAEAAAASGYKPPPVRCLPQACSWKQIGCTATAPQQFPGF